MFSEMGGDMGDEEEGQEEGSRDDQLFGRSASLLAGGRRGALKRVSPHLRFPLCRLWKPRNGLMPFNPTKLCRTVVVVHSGLVMPLDNYLPHMSPALHHSQMAASRGGSGASRRCSCRPSDTRTDP